MRHPILYSLIDTNATNTSIVYCSGNRDAVLIKTIHAWPLIWRHLCKCIPANNYHLDGLNVVTEISRWHCNLSTLIFSIYPLIFSVFSCSITDQTSRVWRACREERINSVSQMSGHRFSFPKGLILTKNTIHLTDLNTIEKKNWMKVDQGH